MKLAYLLGESDDDKAPAEPTDQDGAEWAEAEHLEEITNYMRQFARLDYRSQQIVEAAITSAFRLARVSDELLPEDVYEVSVGLKKEKDDS